MKLPIVVVVLCLAVYRNITEVIAIVTCPDVTCPVLTTTPCPQITCPPCPTLPPFPNTTATTPTPTPITTSPITSKPIDDEDCELDRVIKAIKASAKHGFTIKITIKSKSKKVFRGKLKKERIIPDDSDCDE